MPMMLGRTPYRQYRRYTRRSWRRGGLPVMLIGTGEPAGLIAAAAISRWAYRHRSAFAPFGITIAEFAIAAMLHRHHQHWWIPVMCATMAAAIVLGIPHRIMWAHPSMNSLPGSSAARGRHAESTGPPNAATPPPS
jgi:hypothetical protein